ncbi:hypothetical protein ABPG75_010726 [Micractinium tetrahymenae]
MERPCDAAAAVELPLHLLEAIFSLLDARDLLACAGVSTTWRNAAGQDSPWRAARLHDFPAADDATVAVLLERAAFLQRPAQQQAASQGKHPIGNRGAERGVYRWLAQAHTCDRCGQEFTDGVNTPTACCFHPGILFSGGQLNGTGLRFTCCNRRAHHIPNGSRDSNGCATAFHAGGQSAWQRHGSGVKPREQPPEAAISPGGSSSVGAGSSASAHNNASGSSAASSPPRHYPWVPFKGLQEWHPNQRYGLLELPSRLLFGSGSGGSSAGAP